ncbi:MAG: hypothetical protein QW542_08030, partial [Thermoproteota archaeon]
SYVSNMDELNEREIEALLKASSALNCNNLLIISWDVEEQIEVNGRVVKLVPLWKWLLKPLKHGAR